MVRLYLFIYIYIYLYILGNAGFTVLNSTGEKVSRITGLGEF